MGGKLFSEDVEAVGLKSRTAPVSDIGQEIASTEPSAESLGSYSAASLFKLFGVKGLGGSPHSSS
jgi:hypothetical protein